MAIKFYDICTKKTYKSGGVDKVKWLKCGTFKILDNEKMFIEMNNQPDISFYVFEQTHKEKPKEESPEFGG